MCIRDRDNNGTDQNGGSTSDDAADGGNALSGGSTASGGSTVTGGSVTAGTGQSTAAASNDSGSSGGSSSDGTSSSDYSVYEAAAFSIASPDEAVVSINVDELDILSVEDVYKRQVSGRPGCEGIDLGGTGDDTLRHRYLRRKVAASSVKRAVQNTGNPLDPDTLLLSGGDYGRTDSGHEGGREDMPLPGSSDSARQ